MDSLATCHIAFMSDFKDLKVWQKAHALAVAVNRVAKASRGSADAELRSQMKRAAMSIPANIAEGVAARRATRSRFGF